MNFHDFSITRFLLQSPKWIASFFCTVTGLFIGAVLACIFSDQFLIFDYSTLLLNPAPIGLLCANLVPIILVFVFKKYSLYVYCYLLIFILCLSVGFSGVGMYYVFGDGAWILRLTLLISRSASPVIMWCICLFRSSVCLKYFLILLSIVFLLTILDVFVIIPFFLNAFITF